MTTPRTDRWSHPNSTVLKADQLELMILLFSRGFCVFENFFYLKMDKTEIFNSFYSIDPGFLYESNAAQNIDSNEHREYCRLKSVNVITSLLMKIRGKGWSLRCIGMILN